MRMIISNLKKKMRRHRNEVLYRIWKLAHRQNRNCMILVVGGTGLGKSLACVKMALSLQKDWTLNNLVFHAKDFLHLLNFGKLNKGDVIIWDECGVEFDARQFYSVMNRMMSYVLQTFRHKNLIVFFNTPHEGMVDVNLKRLFHYQFEVLAVDYHKNACIIKPFEIEVSHKIDSNKIYKKYPRGVGGDWGIYPITRFETGLPPKEVVKEYEAKKKEFTNWLNSTAEDSVDLVNIKKESAKPKDIEAITEDVWKNLAFFQREWSGRTFIDKGLIMSKYKIGDTNARVIKSELESRLRNAPHV